MARGYCAGHYRRQKYTNGFGVSCTLEGCEKPLYAKGLCGMHYTRLRKLGTTELPPKQPRKPRERPKPPCPHCGNPMTAYSATQCRSCYHRRRTGTPRLGYRRKKNPQGYVELNGYGGHPNANQAGIILEHRKVMCDILGRPLYPGENVHHKNGVRDDNRPENLELWVKAQPAGQRVEDLLVWAGEIIERYA